MRASEGTKMKKKTTLKRRIYIIPAPVLQAHTHLLPQKMTAWKKTGKKAEEVSGSRRTAEVVLLFAASTVCADDGAADQI